MTASTSLRTQGLQPWYWTAPRIAVGLFMLALCALLWLPYRQELDEQRTALISDTLWMEPQFPAHAQPGAVAATWA